MAVIDEIREQKKKAFRTMDAKGKAGYIWYYYKVHILVSIAVLVLSVSFIHQYVTNKPYGFYATLVNSSVQDYPLTESLAEEFAKYGEIDTDEFLVYLDTSVQLSDVDPQYAMTSQEKLLLQMQTGEVHALIADTEVFEGYAQNEYFRNLESVLTSSQLETYRDLLYYTDAATVDTGDDDTYYSETELPDVTAMDIDHRDPSSMQDPVPVGIIVTDFARIQEAGFYSHLSDAGVTFQQHPSEAVFGIPITQEDPAPAVRFLEFLEKAAP